MPATPTQVTTMRLVVLLAATTPAASFKLPWSRSAAAPKSGGYQLGDISKVSRVPLPAIDATTYYFVRRPST